MVSGEVAAGFEPVRQAFQEGFARRGEVGAAVCAIRDGEVVVDLWGGVADRATQRPWGRDTLSTVFSATKGLSAIALAMLADRGQLDLDAPVTRYWPDFGQAGKEAITVRMVLCHRSGLAGVDQPITLDDLADRPERVRTALEEQVPFWPPDADQGYHGVTFGLLVAELFQRAAGVSIGRFLHDEVATPLSAAVHLGLTDPAAHDLSTLIPVPTRTVLTRVIPTALFGRSYDARAYRAGLRRGTDTRRAFAHPADLGVGHLGAFNTPRVQRLELPWVNAIASARGLATVYQPMAAGSYRGVRLVSDEALTALQRRASWAEVDRVLRKPIGFTHGFVKEQPHLFSPHPESFGHPGAGGSLGWSDPVARLSIGYVCNRMDHRIRSPRAVALCRAIYASLGVEMPRA